MSRQAQESLIRKFSYHSELAPTVDLNKLRAWRHLQKKGRLAVEIGCGVGWHPMTWAKNNPTDCILAIERTTNKFEKFQQRILKHPQIKNIYGVHGDAQIVLPSLFKENEVDLIFIFYPNPYPKNKHKNLRFAFNPFTEFLKKILKPNGHIILATNIKSYADEVSRFAPLNFGLTLVQERLLPKDFSPRTHFEKKYLLRGDSCREFIFSKFS